MCCAQARARAAAQVQTLQAAADNARAGLQAAQQERVALVSQQASLRGELDRLHAAREAAEQVRRHPQVQRQVLSKPCSLQTCKADQQEATRGARSARVVPDLRMGCRAVSVQERRLMQSRTPSSGLSQACSGSRPLHRPSETPAPARQQSCRPTVHAFGSCWRCASAC